MSKNEKMITKEEFLAYEEVRVSGKTNMFDVRNVEMLSGLSRKKIIEIIKNYGILKEKYLKKEV
jgi:hypothetical protein